MNIKQDIIQRANHVFYVVMALALAVMLRLVYVQYFQTFKGKLWRERVAATLIQRDTIRAMRGNILAADGSSAGTRKVANDIASSERSELATLEGLYEGWTGEEDESEEGGGPSLAPGPPEDLTHPREVQLVRRMIELHFQGLLAARHERAVGVNPGARLTAKRIEKSIRSDLVALRAALREVRAS